MTLAIENPPADGEYRVFNQFEEVYDVTELALKVQAVSANHGAKVEVRNMDNPRMELEEHYYNPDHQHLLDLGYQPTHDMEQELNLVMEDLLRFRSRIEQKKHAVVPDIHWSGQRHKVDFRK